MKKLLTATALVASIGAATLLTGCATGGFPNRVHYINHDKVAATFVKGGRIIEDEGLTVIANRGVQRGSEVHAKTNHVFIIVDSEADFITGGTMIEPNSTRTPSGAARTACFNSIVLKEPLRRLPEMPSIVVIRSKPQVSGAHATAFRFDRRYCSMFTA